MRYTHKKNSYFNRKKLKCFKVRIEPIISVKKLKYEKRKEEKRPTYTRGKRKERLRKREREAMGSFKQAFSPLSSLFGYP